MEPHNVGSVKESPIKSTIVSHPYDWQLGKDDETGYTTIHCWSLDRNSENNLLRIKNFDCFCYVELPLFLNHSPVNWKGFREKVVFDAICAKLGESRPHRYIYTRREKLYFYKGKGPDGKAKTYPMMLLCFHSKEDMLTAKKKLSWPIKVKGLKGGSGLTTVPLQVWETDISPIRKLLTLRNCKFSQWFKVEGVKATGEEKISTIENEYIIDWKTIDPIPAEETLTWLTKPKIFSFDLETYSDRHNAMPDSLCSKHVIYMCSIICQRLGDPSSRTREIILLGDCKDTKFAKVIKVKSEGEVLDVLQEKVVEHDPDIISGYNILGYDNPYLDDRLKRMMRDWNCLGRIKHGKTDMKTIAWSSSAYKNQVFNLLEMDGRITIDLLPVIKRDFKLPLYRLDFVANHFLGKGKHDVTAKQMFCIFELQKCLSDDYDASNSPIPKSFKDKYREVEDVRSLWIKECKDFALDEMTRVVDYCIVDSDLVVDLFEKINVWIGLISMSNIMGITPSQIFTRGTGVRMQSQIYDEASRKNTVLDRVEFPKSTYEGAFVYDPIPGLYHNIICVDFSSLYPNLMISENIDHKTEIPPELMDKIPDEDCYVIEWDDEEELSDSEDDEEVEVEENPKRKKKKVKRTKPVHHKVKYIKEDIGIMPPLLRRLIGERNNVRRKQKGLSKDSLEWQILEQTQLGIKIVCNSFYGQCGSSFSSLRLPRAAAAITAQARKSTKMMNAYLESKGHKIIYGDSVTGDTPVLIKDGDDVEYREISSLVNDWNKTNDKQYYDVDLEVWSDKGFTKIKNVMRHKTRKKIYQIITDAGCIKVTEDHSLLDKYANEVRPNQVRVGHELLTKPFQIKKKDDGCACGFLVYKNALKAAQAFLDFKSDGRHIEVDAYNDSYYLTFVDKQKKGIIRAIKDLGYIDDYVYDLETENHHFAAGVGELVVHNTDSTMPDIGITDPKKAWEMGEQIAKELTALFRAPMNVEMEMVFHTMLSIKKKMYLCINMDRDGNAIDDPDKMKVRGVLLARRDNCKFQKRTYKSVVWKVMHREPFMDTFHFIVDKCIELASHSVSIDDLVMIKGLGSHYKSKTYMMKIFADEMEKSGNPQVAGDRIPYIVVETKNGEDKIGYKMRPIELFKERAKSEDPEHPDFIYYLEKAVRNGIEKQLFQIGYKEELEVLAKKHRESDLSKVIDKLLTNYSLVFEDFLREYKGQSSQCDIRNRKDYLMLIKDFVKQYNEKYQHKSPEIMMFNFLRNVMKHVVDDLMKKYEGDKDQVLLSLMENKRMCKIVKPLYSYYVKRRNGRKRRLSTRVDKEPIMMMVYLIKAKKEVTDEIKSLVNM